MTSDQQPPALSDPSTAPADQPDRRVASYVVHPALRPRLEQWLETEGFEVQVMTDDPKVPTYIVVPTDERMAWVEHRTAHRDAQAPRTGPAAAPPAADPDGTVHGPVWERQRPPTGH